MHLLFFFIIWIGNVILIGIYTYMELTTVYPATGVIKTMGSKIQTTTVTFSVGMGVGMNIREMVDRFTKQSPNPFVASYDAVSGLAGL